MDIMSMLLMNLRRLQIEICQDDVRKEDTMKMRSSIIKRRIDLPTSAENAMDAEIMRLDFFSTRPITVIF